MSLPEMDRYDEVILRILQREGRITVSKLAEQVHLSESACARRIKALEQCGLIRGYAALIDQAMAGLPVNVFVNLTLRQQEKEELRAFEEAVRTVPQILECYLMTGEYDYTIRVAVSDMADFERLHHQVLTRLPGVVRVHSSVAIRTIKRAQPLPVLESA